METHELRLRINAAAAKTGKTEFVNAINAIKKAVTGLERDTDGVFKRLKKSMETAGSGGVKLKGVDRATLTSIQNYSDFMRGAARANSSVSRTLGTTVRAIRGASDMFRSLQANVDGLHSSLTKTNTVLERQIQLLGQLRSARPAPTQDRPSASTGGGGGSGGGRAVKEANADIERQNALMLANEKRVAQARLELEKYFIAAAATGQAGAIQRARELGAAFGDMSSRLRDVNATAATSRDTMNRWGAALADSKTALTTLQARTKEEAAELINMAKAAREQSKALSELGRNLSYVARLKAQLTKQEEQQQSLTLRGAAAMRQAEKEAANLTARLNAIGNNSGIQSVTQALVRLRGELAAGVNSSLGLKKATDNFYKSIQSTKIGLTQFSAAERAATQASREFARVQADVSKQARLMERDIRSAASATSAVSTSIRGATGNLRGLENAFSATYQAGSLFRTMLGSVTAGAMVRSIFQAGDALDQFNVTMEVASNTTEEAAANFDFVEKLARNFGTGLKGTRSEFAKFAVSANIAGVSMETTQRIFGSVAKALTVLGRGTEDQRLAFLALEQMMSKGTISSEELRRQLGERLPGAVNLMAEAAGVSTAELQKMLKAGELMAVDVLPKFADVLEKRFGPAMTTALGRAGTQFRIFQVEVEKALESIAQQGFLQELALQFRDLTNSMRSTDIQNVFKVLGQGMADFARIFGTSLKFVFENITEIISLIKTISFVVIIRQGALLARSFLLWTENAAAGAISVLNLARSFVVNTNAVGNNAKVMEVSIAGLVAEQRAIFAADMQLRGYNVTLGTNTAKLQLNTQQATVAGGAYAKLTSGLRGTGMLFGTLARGIGALIGPLSLAYVAWEALSLIMWDTAAVAEDSATSYEEAILRMGNANKSLLISANAFDTMSDFDKGIRNAQEYNATVQELKRTLSDPAFAAESSAAFGGLFSELKIASSSTKEALFDLNELISTMGKAAINGTATAESLSDIVNKSGDLQNAIAGLPQSARDAFTEYAKTHEKILQLTATVVALNAESNKFGSDILELRTLSKNAADAKSALAEVNSILGDMQKNADILTTLATTGAGAALGTVDASKITEAVGGLFTLINAYDGSKEAADRLSVSAAALLKIIEEQPAAYQASVSAVVAYLKSMIDAAKSQDTLEASALSAEEAVDKLLIKLKSGPEAINPFIIAMEKAANVSSVIAKASKDTLAALDEDIRIEGIADPIERAVAEGVRAIKEASDFEPISAALKEAEMAFVTAIAQYGVGSVIAQQAQQAVTDAQAAIAAYLEIAAEKLREIEKLKASNKPNKGRSAERAYEREVKALKKLQDQSFVTAEALNDLLEVEKTLSSQAAKDMLTREERLGIMERQHVLAIMEIADAEGLRSSYQTLGQLFEANTVSMQAEQQVRAANAALIRETGAGLDAETAARMRNLIVQELQKDAQNAAIDAQRSFITGLEEENAVYEMLNTGMFENAEVAKLVLQLRMAGIAVTDEYVDSLNRLVIKNRELAAEMANPAKKWLEAVPTFNEAVNQIEANVFDQLSDSLANFVKTGEFSLDSFVTSLHHMAIDALADNAVKELLTLFNMGESGFGFSKLFGAESIADPKAPDTTGATAVADASIQNMGKTIADGSALMSTKLLEGSEGGGAKLQLAIVEGSRQGGDYIKSSIISAFQQSGGAGGGGGLVSALSSAYVPQADGIVSSGFAPINSPMPPVRPGSGAGSAISDALTQGGPVAGKAISSAMTQAGTDVGAGWTDIFSQGASGFSSVFGMLGSAIGGMIGGPAGSAIGQIAGMVLPMLLGFKEGGLTSSPTQVNKGFSMTASAFHNAPSYASGTPNTSGIPAILHDNEAVIPLTGNRKVPVEMGGGGGTQIVQNFNFPGADPDTFRRSRGQVAADAAQAANRALRSNG